MRTTILLLAASLLLAQDSAPKVTIKGTVVNENGKPQAGLMVEAVTYENGKPKLHGQAATDLEGRYSMAVTLGTVLVRTRATGGNSVTIRYVLEGGVEHPQPVIVGTPMTYHPRRPAPVRPSSN